MVNHGLASQLANLGGHIIDGPRRRTASKAAAAFESTRSPSQPGFRLSAIAAPPRHCSPFVRATPTTSHHFAAAVCNDDDSHRLVGARSGASNNTVTPGPQVARGGGEPGGRTVLGTASVPVPHASRASSYPPYPPPHVGICYRR